MSYAGDMQMSYAGVIYCYMQVLYTVICRCYILLYAGVMVTGVIVTPMYSKCYILSCPDIPSVIYCHVQVFQMLYIVMFR